MKKKIGRWLLSFFIIMFFCTLIARGASSMTVAKVTTAGLSKGNLTYRFQGKGKLVAGSKVSLSLPEGQKLSQILVNIGGEIIKDQPVVQLDLAYLEECIKNQKREIEKLQIQIQQQEIESKATARVPATEQASLSLKEAADQLTAVKQQAKQAGTEGQVSATEEVKAAEEAYRQAKQAYELAEKEEAAFQANEAVRKQSAELSKKSYQIELEKLQEELDRLEQLQQAEGIVASPTDGILAAVTGTEGSVTTGAEQLMIETGSIEGCGILPPEQVGIVKAGDELQVSLPGISQSLPVSIDRFGTDQDGNHTWYGKVEGSYRTGTEFSYEYQKKSENTFEQLIPLSALHESQGMEYVLIAEIRPGILGEVYTAVRVPVTLSEKDEEYAAIQTSLSEEARIIVSSDKYVEEGDRVRLESS